VPNSLVKPSATPVKAIAARGVARGGSAETFFSNENRGAYHWVKETMWQSQKRLARAAVKMVLLDSIITAGPGTTGVAYLPGSAATPTQIPATAAHVWTDAEVAAIQALLPPSFAANTGFSKEAKLPKTGDGLDLPAFAFSSVDKVADTVNAAYDVKVVFASEQSEDDTVATIQESNNFYWTSDKKQFKVSYEKNDTSTATPTVLEMNFVAFDGSTASPIMAAGRQSKDGSMSLQVKADAASTTSGVFITFTSTILADQSDEYKGDSAVTATGTTFSISADGYADNAGGTINETFVYTVGGVSTTYYFKESFDASGKLTLAQSATDATFTVLSPIVAVSTPGARDDYQAKETEVKTEHQSMDASPAAQELQKEEKQHAGEMKGSGVDLEFTVPTGQTAPAVGETWDVSDSQTDFTGTHLLGSGTITESGHIKIVFAAKPAKTLTTVYIAKDSAGVANTANVISINFDR
jgi:hypothetical protein